MIIIIDKEKQFCSFQHQHFKRTFKGEKVIRCIEVIMELHLGQPYFNEKELVERLIFLSNYHNDDLENITLNRILRDWYFVFGSHFIDTTSK